MHRPPAVSFQAGRSRWHAAVLLGVGAVALMTLPLLALGPHSQSPAWALGGQALLVVFTGAAAARAWWRSPVGTLRWDGEHWVWVATEELPVSRLHMVADFQRVVMVSLRLADGSQRWLWLERAHASAQVWSALRRALVHTIGLTAGQTSAAGAGAGTP